MLVAGFVQVAHLPVTATTGLLLAPGMLGICRERAEDAPGGVIQ